MEKAIIVYKPEIVDFINELVYLLFIDGYFDYIENAVQYKDDIIDFIENNITTFPHKNTPMKLLQCGSKYIYYKANKRTSWYIFFEQDDNRFMITFITNNHSAIASYL